MTDCGTDGTVVGADGSEASVAALRWAKEQPRYWPRRYGRRSDREVRPACGPFWWRARPYASCSGTSVVPYCSRWAAGRAAPRSHPASSR